MKNHESKKKIEQEQIIIKTKKTSNGLEISKANKLMRTGIFFKIFSGIRDFLNS